MVTQESPEALNAYPGDAALLGGRYRLGEVLGRGAMATVYRAFDGSLGRDVAVKVFAAGSTEEEVRQQTETRVLAEFNHPGLVTLYDGGTDRRDEAAPRRFLVMELVDGTDLRRRLDQGPMPQREVAAMGAALASALAHVHGHGVIHRDVKPANVLLQAEPGGESSAKLADFGIARIVDGDRLTATGSTVGTASYLSPEQAMGSALSPASDIYSLGLVLLECLKGKTEYPGMPVESAVARVHRAPVIPTELDPRLAELLGAMTDIRPEARPDAKNVAEVLGLVLEDGSAASTSARTRILPAIPDHPPSLAITAEQPARRPRAQRKRISRARRKLVALMAAAAAALLTAVVVLSIALNASTPPPVAPVETNVPPANVEPTPAVVPQEAPAEMLPEVPSEEGPAAEPVPDQAPAPTDPAGAGAGKSGQNEPKGSKGRGKD